MTLTGWLQIALIFGLVALTARPLGLYMARVFAGERTFLSPVLGAGRARLLSLAGVDPAREQDWLAYTIAMLAFSVAGFVSLYALQRLQDFLPLNPQGFDGVRAGSRLQHRRSASSPTPTGRTIAARRR